MSSVESSFSEAGESEEAGNGNFSDTGQVIVCSVGLTSTQNISLIEKK